MRDDGGKSPSENGVPLFGRRSLRTVYRIEESLGLWFSCGERIKGIVFGTLSQGGLVESSLRVGDWVVTPVPLHYDPNQVGLSVRMGTSFPSGVHCSTTRMVSFQ